MFAALSFIAGLCTALFLGQPLVFIAAGAGGSSHKSRRHK